MKYVLNKRTIHIGQFYVGGARGIMVIAWFLCVLWYINLCSLFNAKSMFV